MKQKVHFITDVTHFVNLTVRYVFELQETRCNKDHILDHTFDPESEEEVEETEHFSYTPSGCTNRFGQQTRQAHKKTTYVKVLILVRLIIVVGKIDGRNNSSVQWWNQKTYQHVGI